MRQPVDVYDRPRVHSCSGDTVHLLRKLKYMADGTLRLEVVGNEPIQPMIDSYLSGCDIQQIIRRLAEGDTSVIPDREPLYGDFSELPKSPIEVLNYVSAVKSDFASLPAETRAKFDNDFAKYLSAAMDPESYFGSSGDNSESDVSGGSLEKEK